MKRRAKSAGIGVSLIGAVILLCISTYTIKNQVARPQRPAGPTSTRTNQTIDLHPNQRQRIYDRLKKLAETRSPLYEQEALAAMQSGDIILPTGVLGFSHTYDHTFTEPIEVAARQMAQTDVAVKRELAIALGRRTAHQRESIEWLLDVIAEPGVADYKLFAADALLNNQSCLSDSDIERALQEYRYQSVVEYFNQYVEKQAERFREILHQRRIGGSKSDREQTRDRR